MRQQERRGEERRGEERRGGEGREKAALLAHVELHEDVISLAEGRREPRRHVHGSHAVAVPVLIVRVAHLRNREQAKGSAGRR